MLRDSLVFGLTGLWRFAEKAVGASGLYSVYGANGVIGRYDKFNHVAPQLLHAEEQLAEQ